MCSQEYDYNFKLAFQTEWYDPVAQNKRTFLMSFYPGDSTVELYDINQRKMFLRRSLYDGLRLKDLFVGNTVTIYDRLVKITEYNDNTTRNFIGKWKQHTFALIKPSGMPHLGEIFSEIYAANYTIERLRMCTPSRTEILNLYENLTGNPQLPFIVEHMCSAPIVALELVGEDAINGWRKMMGPADSQEAKKTAPGSLRARFGYDLASNAVHGAEDHEQATKSACYFFPQGIDRKPPPNTARINNSTCCIIKPHAIDEGKLGTIVNVILKNFAITAMQMFYMTPTNVEEFLEVYRGVISNYHSFLHSFMSGPCFAIEISAKEGDPEGRDVHGEFRKLCGPMDCDVAKNIRPNSLRGMFGKERYLNAVHCTDLAEDCEQELEYFFKILDE